MSGATLERRLANFRSSLPRTTPAGADRGRSLALAERMAETLDGEIVSGPLGTIVRCEPTTVVLPIERERLAVLPGQPPPEAPLLCLDTETTGLATATGTVAWLIGLGWWEADRFRQAQLLLPDHSDEPALLAILADYLPAAGWLVTYNGRGFDWPLLTTRFRMNRHDPPAHAGHLDLLPFVRRVFRHRMTDARLQTAETILLGASRIDDVGGWEIPGRYHQFLHGGEAGPLLDVVRHNREDVRSLGRLLAHIDQGYADPAMRADAPRGDLAGLARAFARERRLEEALACLEAALGVGPGRVAENPASYPADGDEDGDDGWWLPARRPDVGGRPRRSAGWAAALPDLLASPWTEERVVVERARLLRRLGRYEEAVTAWRGLAAGVGAIAVQALVEIAKLREHRLADPVGALVAATRAWELAERRRRMGIGDVVVQRALVARLERLRRRVGPVSGSAGSPGRPWTSPDPASAR